MLKLNILPKTIKREKKIFTFYISLKTFLYVILITISVYTMMSIFRMHEIEVELRKQFDIKLHKSIHETPKLRGLHITMLFYGTVFLAWWIRFIIFGLLAKWHWSLYAISIIIFVPLVIVLLWLKRIFPNFILEINSLLLEEKIAKEQEILQG